MRKIKIIEVPSELGAGTRGSSLGIEALKRVEAETGNGIFSTFPSSTIETENERLLGNINKPWAKRVDGVVSINKKTASRINSELKEGNWPLVISGDHSNAVGSISGIKKFIEDKRLGIIWIDAHADLHTPYTSPSGNVHGMPLAALANDDNIPCKRNEPSDEAKRSWENLKSVGVPGPKYRYEDLAFVALRDYEKEEAAIIERNKVLHFKPNDYAQSTMNEVAEKCLGHLSGCDHIYISFDVDSLDPSISVGTGTPVKNGLSIQQAESLLSVLLNDERVICFEVTEVNPLLDTTNKMAKAILPLLQKLFQ